MSQTTAGGKHNNNKSGAERKNSGMFDHDTDLAAWAARGLGALLGVVASMMIVAPEGTRNAFYRLWVGVTLGATFSPLMRNFQWFDGDAFDYSLARAAAMSFVVWFVLEIIARFLSNTDWIVKVSQEIIRLRYGDKE